MLKNRILLVFISLICLILAGALFLFVFRSGEGDQQDKTELREIMKISEDAERREGTLIAPGAPGTGKEIAHTDKDKIPSRTPGDSSTIMTTGEKESERSHSAGETSPGSSFLDRSNQTSASHIAITSQPTITPQSSPTPKPEISISGTVTNEENSPIPNVQIRVMSRDRPGDLAVTVLTQTDGTYILTNSPEGNVEIAAIPDPESIYAMPESRIRFIQIGEQVKNENFILKQGDMVEGIVVSEEENPILDAAVQALMAGIVRTMNTDGEGRFVVRGIPQDRTIQRLTVSHPDYQPETRTMINMFDGEQKFVLKKTNIARLKVIWGMDESPVEFYAYRLLKKQRFQDMFIDTERKNIKVESPDGSTPLGTMESGTWHVEVTVLSPEGNETDLRGSTQFTLDKGQEGFEALVKIDQGRRIAGKVSLNAKGGEPVEGAGIGFVAPSAGFGRFPVQDKPFQFSTATSDGSGQFSFEGIPPGRYTLQARKDTLLSPGAVDLLIPFEKDPEPIEIVMLEGGVIYGAVTGKAAAALSGARITLSEERPNADGWMNRETTTNEEGKYEFTGLSAGAHYVWAQADDNKKDSRHIDLGPGQKIEVNFDFSGAVKLSGVILFNGIPVKTGTFFHFLGEGDARSNWISIGNNGMYEATVNPGRYILRFGGEEAPGGQMEPFMIPDTPLTQERNFDFTIVNADVILTFPQDGQFEPGQLVISPPERLFRYGFYRVKMDQAKRHVVSLFAGRYQATFRSTNGVWHGESEWVDLNSGQNNTFVIEVKKTMSGVRVGGWSPGQLSLTNFTPLIFDVTPVLESAGDIEVLVMYQNGRHAVETGPVSLLAGSQIVARDDHKGWSGADHWNNAYHLRLNEIAPGTVYRLEIQLRSDGGTDSTGSVYLSLN